MDLFKKIIIAAATMLVLDGVWLGLVAPRFYYENLKHLTRGVGKIDVHYGSAAAVYIFMLVAFLVFLSPLVAQSAWGETLIKSFIFGVLIYGIYDFTNMATLRDWPVFLSFVDMVWGGVLFLITGAVFKFALEQGWIAANT